MSKNNELANNKDDKSSNKNGRRTNSRNRGRKGNSKPRDEHETRGRKECIGDVNNPAYYYEDANVLSQVMNFSFNQFGGVPIDMSVDNYQYSAHNTMMAVFWINPSIPQTSSSDEYVMDGATTAALRNYLALSGSNNKTTIYGPQDVIITTLAVGDLIKASTAIARCFGLAYLFNYRNRTYPDTILQSMQIDVEDFNANLAPYRVRFNKLLTLASKIPFPADIPLFRKASELFAYIYLDDQDSALAQTYFMMPHSLWRFNEAYDENGSGLDTFDLFQSNISTTKMSEVLDNFESMISALLNSTSLNAIYSDIMRLVQNGKLTNLIKFNPIPEDFVITPVYNAEVKDWLHNGIVCGWPMAKNSTYQPEGLDPLSNENDVSCDTNTNKLFYHPQFVLRGSKKNTGEWYGKQALIDFDHDNVTIEDKVRATRFSQRWTALMNLDSESGLYQEMMTGNLAFADEYIVEIDYYTGENDIPYYIQTSSFIAEDKLDEGEAIRIANVLSKFDWAPLFYYVDPAHHSIEVLGDLDYYTTLNFDVLKRIYDYEIIHLLQIG